MSDIVERLHLTADWLDQPPPRSNPPQFSLVSVQREAVDEIEMLWNAVAEKNAEIERLRDIDNWSFDDLVTMAKRILDERYPADIFTGESGDVGPRFVVALRAVIEELGIKREPAA